MRDPVFVVDLSALDKPMSPIPGGEVGLGGDVDVGPWAKGFEGGDSASYESISESPTTGRLGCEDAAKTGGVSPCGGEEARIGDKALGRLESEVEGVEVLAIRVEVGAALFDDKDLPAQTEEVVETPCAEVIEAQ